jgi:hypothetical protein
LSEGTIRKCVLHREIPFYKVRKAVKFRASEIEVWIKHRGTTKGGAAAVEGELFTADETGGNAVAAKGDDRAIDGRCRAAGELFTADETDGNAVAVKGEG